MNQMITRPDQDQLPALMPVPGLQMPGMGAEDAETRSMWSVIDDRLRGRWLWMVIVGLALAVWFGVMGWRSDIPVYQSKGAIRIQSRLPHTMREISETSTLSHFGMYVGTQVQLIKSPRVLARALEDEKLASAEFAGSSRAVTILERGIDAEADRGSELVFVNYTAETPELAQNVVGAVVGAYMDIWGQADSGEIGQKLQRLYDYEHELGVDMRSVESEVTRIVQRHGAADLRALQTRKLETLDGVNTQINRAELALKQMETGEGGASSLTDEVTEKQLEAIDERLAELGGIRDRAENNFEDAELRYRVGSRQYNYAKDQAEIAREAYDARVRDLMSDWDRVQAQLAQLGEEGLPIGLTAEQLRAEIESLEAERESLENDSRQLLEDLSQLADLEQQEEYLQGQLSDAKRRRQQLELEEPILRVGRISVVQEATLPVDVYADGRQKRAAFGVICGFAMSFGAFFLLGSLDRRTYGTSQVGSGTNGSDIPCLGVLPNLKRSDTDRETTDVASHCVHQIRNQIEVRRGQSDTYALAITSPHQGDGKTSVVMALGWSYAAAGYDTILVDCDLVGRSLTRQLGLVGRSGLKEAIQAGTTNGEITELPVPHLSALAAGADPHFGPESVRRRDLNTLVEQLRQQYDMIIIDTGPLLGALESTPVVTTADGVVVLARRGRSRSRLDEVTKRLATVGARCLGVILNGAVRSECDRYVSEASLAAVEEAREGKDANDPTVVRAAEGERNALMLAMESTSRPPGAQDESDDWPEDDIDDHAS